MKRQNTYTVLIWQVQCAFQILSDLCHYNSSLETLSQSVFLVASNKGNPTIKEFIKEILSVPSCVGRAGELN